MEPNSNVSVPNSTGQLEGPVSLFTSSWELFKANWKVLVPIIIAPTALMYVGQIFMMSGNPGLVFVAFILVIIAAIFSITMTPAALDAIRKISDQPGTPITFKGQYSFGFKYFWSIVLLMLMQILIAFGSMALFLIPGIIVSIYVGMYLFARVLDEKKGFEAFTESYSLVNGRWFPVLGRYAFLVLVYIVGAIITTGLGFIIRVLLSIPVKSTGEAVLSIILMLVLSGFLTPVIMVYTYKLYQSLKATRLPNVSVVGFKKWLIAFMVIGVIAIISIPIIAGATFFVLRNEQRPLDRSYFSDYSMDWPAGRPSSADSANK